LEERSALLISLYQEEKARLEGMIKECLEDFDGPDYDLANYHQRAIFKVNRTLSILNHLEDTLYNQKEFCRQRISNLEKKLADSELDYDRKVIEGYIDKEKDKLEYLLSLPVHTPETDPHILEKTISDLVHRNIKKFKLVLNKSMNVYLEFSRSRNNINIVLPEINYHTRKYTFCRSHLKNLELLGFNKINSNRIGLTLVNEGEETKEKIVYMLTKLVFEIFNGIVSSKDSYIEV
jgi:hypothetical protein